MVGLKLSMYLEVSKNWLEHTDQIYIALKSKDPQHPLLAARYRVVALEGFECLY